MAAGLQKGAIETFMKYLIAQLQFDYILWYYVSESNNYSSSMLRQHKFLTSLVGKLEKEDTAKEVLLFMHSVKN